MASPAADAFTQLLFNTKVTSPAAVLVGHLNPSRKNRLENCFAFVAQRAVASKAPTGVQPALRKYRSLIARQNKNLLNTVQALAWLCSN